MHDITGEPFDKIGEMQAGNLEVEQDRSMESGLIGTSSTIQSGTSTSIGA